MNDTKYRRSKAAFNLFFNLSDDLQNLILSFHNPYEIYFKKNYRICLKHLLLKSQYNIQKKYLKYLDSYIYGKEQNIITTIYCVCGVMFHIEDYVEYKIDYNNKKRKNKYFRPIRDLIEAHINGRHFEIISGLKNRYLQIKKEYDKIIKHENNNNYYLHFG